MNELDNLLEALEAWCLPEHDINHTQAVFDTYAAYKAALPPLVLEQCPHNVSSKTILFLNKEIPVVVFECISYRLPEDKT